MNQIFDKLGIYDLVAVLLSGICITTFSLVSDRILFQSQLSNFLKVENTLDTLEDTLLFLVISYFVGISFQEVGSFIQRWIYKNNRLLLKALDTSKKTHRLLTQEEKEGIYQTVQKELNLETAPDEEVLYNYCKFYLITTGNMARADRDQSTLGLSRSLSLYFFLLSLITYITYFRSQNDMYYTCAVGMLLLAVLLWHRYIRFAKMRYIYILRSFYYSFLQNKSEMSTKILLLK